MEKIGKFSFNAGLWATTFTMSNVIILCLTILAICLNIFFGEGPIADAIGAVIILGLGALLTVGHIRATYFILNNSTELFDVQYPKYKDCYYWSWVGAATRFKMDWLFIKYTFNFKRAQTKELLSI